MGKYYDGRGCMETSQVFLEPRELVWADLGFGARDVVQSDKVDATMVERIKTLSQNISVKSAVIQPGIVLSGNAFNDRHIDAFGNFHELLHALGVDIFVLAVVGQIAGEEHQ